MRNEEMAAYRAKLRRIRTWGRMFRLGWFVAEVVVCLIYKKVFNIDMFWVMLVLSGMIPSNFTGRWKISTQEFRVLMVADTALRARWYQEHDERMLTINMRAGSPFVEYMCVVLNVAALIAIPFSKAVSATLVAVSWIQTMASSIVKGYWMRKLTGAEVGEEDE